MIPFFAEPIDIRQKRNTENKENTNNINKYNDNDHNSMHLHSSIIDDKDGNTQVGLVSDDPVAVKLLNRYDLSIICA